MSQLLKCGIVWTLWYSKLNYKIGSGFWVKDPAKDTTSGFVCNTNFNRNSCSDGNGEGYNRKKSYAGLTVLACASLHNEAHA